MIGTGGVLALTGGGYTQPCPVRLSPRTEPSPPSPLPAARPDPRERGADSGSLISISGGSKARRCHLPLSRGSGCADGRVGRGVRVPALERFLARSLPRPVAPVSLVGSDQLASGDRGEKGDLAAEQ